MFDISNIINKFNTLNVDILQYIIIVLGYVVTIATSGLIVRYFVGKPEQETPPVNPNNQGASANFDTGAIIGKCENFLTITLILANAYTGLALIFAAKSIIRSEDIKGHPKYYLGGTLVNFSYSVLMAFVVRLILSAIGHPIPSLPTSGV